MSRRTATVIASLAVGLAMSSGAPVAAEITSVLENEDCYKSNKAKITNAHKEMGETCATECAKKGNQVALVTKSGEVYQVMAMGALAGEKNAKLVPHMSHTVTLTG